ncbi:siroheme synthase [Helicobacter sp. MIT 14-3879]|uniref:siroheme synthase n=1 Tax=Helicobacter sp. MIT 14-3879 TaxID=2040649 RepID=UPI000E1E3568|nr:SAM-dependent methyltransferase [Helicobacter sp. MIT 14-3879]RDU64754.1 uroporphyrinogen-III C-methyltransferase [Helicobacter sp. MIT 14-3879]
MNSFSLPIALTPKKVLLIGAGKIAYQKYKVLLDSRWEVNIVAREIRAKEFENIPLCMKHINTNTDLYFFSEFDLIIDASGDEKLGTFLWNNRKKLGYLLNVVDKPNLCDFYFGAIARYDNVSIMVSSNGASPILAQSIRDKIQRLIPKTISKFSQNLKLKRKNYFSNEEKMSIKKQCLENLGKVFIIGCGPNDFTSLTLKALEVLEIIDVALIDNLVGKEIWEFLESAGVECISVGKQKGKQSFKQEQINELMLKYTKDGKCVGRLKGGDPCVFGRVWEEASFLQAHNVNVEMISGISSSLAGALNSGIIPTIRGLSSGVLIVSAHLRESIFHSEWLLWLKDSPYTLIVMMAYSFAKEIYRDANKLGVDMTLPAAFISKVDSINQKIVIGKLSDIEELAKICDKPAILILGKVIDYAKQMPYNGTKIII